MKQIGKKRALRLSSETVRVLSGSALSGARGASLVLVTAVTCGCSEDSNCNYKCYPGTNGGTTTTDTSGGARTCTCNG